MSAQSSAGHIRCRVTFDERDGLRITIPADANPVGAAVLGSIGIVTGLAILLHCCPFQGLGFLGTLGKAASIPPGWWFSLSVVSLFCLIGAASTVLALRSREVIQIDRETIAMRTEGYYYHFGRGSAQAFSLSHVRNLRYAPARHRSRGRGPHGFSIAFDSKGSTGRFGFNLSEEESRRLIKTIKARYQIPANRVESLPVEHFDGNGARRLDERNTRRRSFSPPIRSRVASDEINGFVITIPSSSIELPSWVVVGACTVCVPFISIMLFGLFACVIGPFRGTPIPLSVFWITTALSVPIAALFGFREPGDGEVIQFVDDTLILAKKSGAWSRRREFDIARIRNLRLVTGTDQRIAFDYQGQDPSVWKRSERDRRPSLDQNPL